MAEEKAKLIEKVLARLTDFRMRLDPAERNILDEIVVGKRAEVEGHAWDPGMEVHGRIDWKNETYRFQPRFEPKQEPKQEPRHEP